MFVSANVRPHAQYACRKTLADSRPRVKGRFARNGETDTEAEEREASDNSYGYDYGCGHNELSNGNGNTTYSAGSCYDGHNSNRLNGDNGEWWWRAPVAAAVAAAADDEAQRQRQVVGFDEDEELWASLGDMLSVNLAS
jgi:hypothetical protein